MIDFIGDFKKKGTAFIPNFFSKKTTKALVSDYLGNIRNNQQEFLRVKSLKNEKHLYSKEGIVMNPILNVHNMSLDEASTNFSKNLKDFIANSQIIPLMESLLGCEPLLVQSMYIEGNRGTERHFDSDLFDAAQKNTKMIGCWIALEDIAVDGGGLLYYPESHQLNNADYFSVEVKQLFEEYLSLSNKKILNYQKHDRKDLLSIYRKGNQILETIIEESGIRETTHHYKMGDVVLFDSNILHGTKKGKSQNTRHSISLHFIPKNADFIRHKKEIEKTGPITENGLTFLP